MLILFGLARSLPLARQDLAITLALIAVAIQSAAVYWTFYKGGIGPQGRYLFPVLLPTLLLACTGWDHIVPPSRRARSRVVLVALIAALDAAGWLFVAVPAYARG